MIVDTHIHVWNFKQAQYLWLEGDTSILNRTYHIEEIKKKANMIWWNKEGFKFGICDQKPLDMDFTLLSLSNNTAVEEVFSKLQGRFQKLFKKKMFLHHYLQYIEEREIEDASTEVEELIWRYKELDKSEFEPFEFDKYKRYF